MTFISGEMAAPTSSSCPGPPSQEAHMSLTGPELSGSTCSTAAPGNMAPAADASRTSAAWNILLHMCTSLVSEIEISTPHGQEHIDHRLIRSHHLRVGNSCRAVQECALAYQHVEEASHVPQRQRIAEALHRPPANDRIGAEEKLAQSPVCRARLTWLNNVFRLLAGVPGVLDKPVFQSFAEGMVKIRLLQPPQCVRRLLSLPMTVIYKTHALPVEQSHLIGGIVSRIAQPAIAQHELAGHEVATAARLLGKLAGYL